MRVWFDASEESWNELFMGMAMKDLKVIKPTDYELGSEATVSEMHSETGE